MNVLALITLQCTKQELKKKNEFFNNTWLTVYIILALQIQLRK